MNTRLFVVLCGSLLLIGTAHALETVPRPTIVQPTPIIKPPTSFPAFKPQLNPLLQTIADQCTQAKKLVDSCNLCKDAVKAAQDACTADKTKQQQTDSTTCQDATTTAFNNGAQSATDDMKNKAKSGYIFPLFGSNQSCESFCSHIKADDGHLMTCIASITTTGGCLSDVSLKLGACTGHSSDALCMCI